MGYGADETPDQAYDRKKHFEIPSLGNTIRDFNLKAIGEDEPLTTYLSGVYIFPKEDGKHVLREDVSPSNGDGFRRLMEILADEYYQLRGAQTGFLHFYKAPEKYDKDEIKERVDLMTPDMERPVRKIYKSEFGAGDGSSYKNQTGSVFQNYMLVQRPLKQAVLAYFVGLDQNSGSIYSRISDPSFMHRLCNLYTEGLMRCLPSNKLRELAEEQPTNIFDRCKDIAAKESAAAFFDLQRMIMHESLDFVGLTCSDLQWKHADKNGMREYFEACACKIFQDILLSRYENYLQTKGVAPAADKGYVLLSRELARIIKDKRTEGHRKMDENWVSIRPKGTLPVKEYVLNKLEIQQGEVQGIWKKEHMINDYNNLNSPVSTAEKGLKTDPYNCYEHYLKNMELQGNALAELAETEKQKMEQAEEPETLENTNSATKSFKGPSF